MTDDEIKTAITQHYQVEIDNLPNTDALADMISYNDDDVEQAGRLLSGARVEIHWTE